MTAKVCLAAILVSGCMMWPTFDSRALASTDAATPPAWTDGCPPFPEHGRRHTSLGPTG